MEYRNNRKKKSCCIYQKTSSRVLSECPPPPYQSTGSRAPCGRGRFLWPWPVSAAASCPASPLGESHRLWCKVHWTLVAPTAGHPPSMSFKGRRWVKPECDLTVFRRWEGAYLGGRMVFRMSSFSCLLASAEGDFGLGGGGMGLESAGCWGFTLRGRPCGEKYLCTWCYDPN